MLRLLTFYLLVKFNDSMDNLLHIFLCAGETFTKIALTFVEFFTVEMTLFQALCYLSLGKHPVG